MNILLTFNYNLSACMFFLNPRTLQMCIECLDINIYTLPQLHFKRDRVGKVFISVEFSIFIYSRL